MEMFKEIAEPEELIKLNFEELSKKEDPIAILETKTKALEVQPDFKITTEDEYEIALEKLKEFTSLDKEVHKLTDPVCTATNQAHKEATSMRTKLLNPIKTIKTAYQRAIGDYDYKKEMEQRAAIKKLEDERQAKIDALRLEKAEELEKEGKLEEAEAILDIEFDVAPIVVEREKTNGLQYRDNWQAEVIDKAKIPIEYLVPDVSAMTAHAKEFAKSAKRKDPNAEIVSDIAGVRFVNRRIAITS